MVYSVILGSKDFIIEIKDKFIGKKKQGRNLPALRSFANRPDIEQISETVDAVIRSNNKLARQIKLHCCHKYSGKKLKEIGACFSIVESRGEWGVGPQEHFDIIDKTFKFGA